VDTLQLNMVSMNWNISDKNNLYTTNTAAATTTTSSSSITNEIIWMYLPLWAGIAQ